MGFLRTSFTLSRIGSIATGLALSITAPAFGQVVPATDGAMDRTIALSAKTSTMRPTPIERSFHDSIMVGASDKLFVGESLLTPYRSTASDPMPSGITWKLPSTNLALSNGSAWLRRASEGTRRNGMRVSVQLTY